MEKNDFVGYFERTPVENLYHTVEIILNEDQLVWKNDSDQSWKIDFDGEKLAKADDEVYEAQELQFEESNSKVTAVIFQNEHYYRVEKRRENKSESSDSSSDSESAKSTATVNPTTDVSAVEKQKFVGHYERKPVENDYHTVQVSLEDNQLLWKNNNGKCWKLGFDGEKLSKTDNEVYDAQELQFEENDGKVDSLIFQGEHYYRKETIADAKPDKAKTKCSFLCFSV